MSRQEDIPRAPATPLPVIDWSAVGREAPKVLARVIYNDFGIYTSVNGALLTWATIAAHTGDSVS